MQRSARLPVGAAAGQAAEQGDGLAHRLGRGAVLQFVEEDDHFLLKTVIPSRKATRDYLNKGEQDV